jgi:hypothetical protein
MGIQNINHQAKKQGLTTLANGKSKDKKAILASIMPAMQRSLKTHGVSLDKLGNDRIIVAAQMILNTSKFAQKLGVKGVHAGMVNSTATEASGLAGHVARTIMLLGPIIQYNTTGFDHVEVFPMKTRNFVHTYPEIYYATNKGSHRQGDLIRSPFETTAQSSTFTTKHIGSEYKALGEAANPETYIIAKSTDEITFELEQPNVVQGTVRIAIGSEVATQNTDGSWVSPSASYTVTQASTGELTVTLTDEAASDTPVFVSYNYDNEKLPRSMVPTIGVRLKKIPMEAEFYQVQIVYDAYADFEATNDYSYKLGAALNEQAPLEVTYTINRLIYDGLYSLAQQATSADELAETIMDFTQSEETRDFENVIKLRVGKLISRVDNVIQKRTGRYGLSNLTFGRRATEILNAVIPSSDPSGRKAGPYKLGAFGKTGIYIDPALQETKILNDGTQIAEGVTVPIGKTVIGYKVPFFGDCKEGNIAAACWGEYMSLVPTDEMFIPSFEKMRGFATAGAFAEQNKVLAVAGAIIMSV